MKRTFLFLMSLVLPVMLAQAQNAAYTRVLNLLHEQHPAILTGGKLVALNVWSAEGQGRDANKAFDKAAKTYEVAKLKGGPKGLVAVSICLNSRSSEAQIMLNKDGNTKLLLLDIQDAEGLEGLQEGNVVFDAVGNEVYRNLDTDKVFSSINQLITR